jgi:hypothetical protein
VLPTANAIFGSNKYFICSNNVPFEITKTVNDLCKVTALANTSDGVAIAPVNAEATWSGAESAEKKSFPVMTVYISNDLHINLETLYDETYWISVSTAQGNAYYSVPKKVYNNILSKYEEK